MFKSTLRRLYAGAAILTMGLAANAQATYDNVAGTFSWLHGNETFATATDNVADALSESKSKAGTDLTVTGPTDYSNNIPEAEVAIMTYQPTTSNAGCEPGDMIEYRIKLKKGLTFTPTSVAFDAVKEGTDNAYFSWSYVIGGVESDFFHYDDPKNQIRRNNNANPSAPLTHNEEINATEGDREFALRFYISQTANNKKMSIGNIKINGIVNGTEIPRAFKNFAIDFTSDPYTVTVPSDGVLPEGVTVNGTWHDSQHGYNTTTITMDVDGPVRIKLGLCQYGNGMATVKAGDELLAEIPCGGACNGAAEWVYNSEEPATLTVTSASYIPFMSAEACELLPMVDVSYYNTDGKLLGVQTVQGGAPFEFAYTVDDVTVPEGQAFRGWFYSDQQTALKHAEGTPVQEDTKLYARATKVEVPTGTSRFIYDLTKTYFYIEDHEAIEIDGKYYNNHGWLVDRGGAIKVNVAGKCYVTIGNCLYSNGDANATVTNEAGDVIAEIPVKADSDGAEYTFQYDGPAGWLSITYPNGAYTHSVAVWNVVDFVEYDETSGYYQIPAGDVSSFLIALKAASGQDGAKIFLPNGLYDLGETVLTNVSGTNISIIGESTEGTIIQNAPAKENEGIGVTATLFNTSSDLYIQDLTIRNAMPFDGSTGRAVTLQDKGQRTICKNVSLQSYQDTYYSNNSSYFYFEGGDIHGVTDYICGGGDVYYNGVTFINEDIKDEATMAAPNGAIKFGYVLNNCTIETLSKRFNYGRSWGAYSGLALLNTTINQPEKLIATRFLTGGMNCAADRFVEYNTMDADGNVISPESNVLEFTHSTGNKKYETILTAEEAAEYAIENVFPDWRAEQIAAQKETAQVTLEGNTLTWEPVEESEAYAVVKDGAIVAITTATSYTVDGTESVWAVRAANARGGFGKAIGSTTGIADATAEEAVDVKYYNMQGIRVGADYRGVVVKVTTTASGKVIADKIVK